MMVLMLCMSGPTTYGTDTSWGFGLVAGTIIELLLQNSPCGLNCDLFDLILVLVFLFQYLWVQLWIFQHLLWMCIYSGEVDRAWKCGLGDILLIEILWQHEDAQKIGTYSNASKLNIYQTVSPTDKWWVSKKELRAQNWMHDEAWHEFKLCSTHQ